MSMPSIVLVNKSGELKQVNVNDVGIESLCKKAGFKTIKDFKLVHRWSVKMQDDYCVELYAKDKGRTGQENKYDFPPPVDNTLFFGSCVLVLKDGNMTEPLWTEIYEFLFGGFEDIGSEDSEEEDDDDSDEYETTKTGYKKDGFVVDDDEDSSEVFEYDDELSEEDYL